ncbi:hypothetical protein DERP_006578 [Dermatophagoides pteronyssinus]|uniref:Uncharacterized protein n=1 Tax=Dermatophagoides pteronyssinus TaxID=6956 RepID=A0ABQ8IQL9_DERPT|nr:hypothetical protein DERP_006578 [Dermatophagoides pteronyssinus]
MYHKIEHQIYPHKDWVNRQQNGPVEETSNGQTGQDFIIPRYKSKILELYSKIPAKIKKNFERIV